ncbi:hypothetical protein PG587_03770, partial [Riemerella anatipestifer]|nr:hypothetical protein [Riemerella anatipestifer]
IVSPTGPPPIIATFLSLSKFICLSVSIRIVIQKWHITHKYTKYFQSEKYFINFLKRNNQNTENQKYK